MKNSIASQETNATEQTSKESKGKVIQFREKRLELNGNISNKVIFKNYYGEQIIAQVENLSQFGVRIALPGESELDTLNNQNINELQIILADQVVYSGGAQIVTDAISKSNFVCYGLSLDGEGIDLDKVRAIIETNSESSLSSLMETKKLLEVSSTVKSEFKCLVADLNTLFQDLRFKLLKEEDKLKKLEVSDTYKKRLEEQIINLSVSLYGDEMHKLFAQFKTLVDTFSQDEVIIHKKYFRSNFHPSVLNAPFLKRAYEKPLGYAGDFGLMVMLYEYGDIGENLFEKFIHRFSCNEPASIANKNRVEFLAEYINEYFEKNKIITAKVSSIACGPAKEIELLADIVDDHKQLNFVLVDQEPKALEYAQSKIKSASRKKNIKSIFLQEDAVLGIIKNKDFVEHIKNSDVIVSAGLFDYLSDRVSKRLIQSFCELIKPGGIILIGNVSKDNPDRFSMDYFMEWNLVLRNEMDLKSLVQEDIKKTLNLKVDVISELLGLNLFLVIEKPK